MALSLPKTPSAFRTKDLRQAAGSSVRSAAYVHGLAVGDARSTDREVVLPTGSGCCTVNRDLKNLRDAVDPCPNARSRRLEGAPERRSKGVSIPYTTGAHAA